MEHRNFKLDTEWNMIHYPERPKGFGIMIIGDERHFVDEKSSFWTQNEGKAAILRLLRRAGYTVFYSNLYGRNWGSDKAVEMARNLYEHVLRTEIINEKIHIIAEGMGALAALKLMKEMEGKIRSVILLNPVLSLKDHLEQEKEHKFFYKKLLKELAISHESDSPRALADRSMPAEEIMDRTPIPVKIIHVLSGGRAYKQSSLLNELSVKWKDEKAPISICYMLPDKKQQLGSQMAKFLKSYEKIL